MVKYKVVAGIKKPWFGEEEIEYRVVMSYEEWYDPTYGNGGGDYVQREKIVMRTPHEQQAVEVCEKLNTYP